MDLQAFNADLIRRFRAGEELTGGMHRERIALLSTIGHRSGQQRTTPVMFTRFHGDPLVIASNDGATSDPFWLVNLRKDPHVVVETPDGARTPSVAEELSGEERSVEWRDLLLAFPFLADHEERAGGRVIPLVRLRAGS